MRTPGPITDPEPLRAARRRALRSVAGLATGVAATLTLPALARAARVPAQMTDGPFYPPAAWRARWADWDADLTRVEERGRVAIARGEHFGLALALVDSDGRVVDAADVQIWQCDAQRQYRHPDVGAAAGTRDEGFQGFGAARSARDGRVAFRTIRPVPYPGRTPHIHVKVRHPAFGEWTSQLFVAGDPGNERDFLWRRLDAQDQAALQMRLTPAPASVREAGADRPPLAWLADHRLVLPA